MLSIQKQPAWRDWKSDPLLAMFEKSHISQEKGSKKKSEDPASLFSSSCASKSLLLVVVFEREVYECWDIGDLQGEQGVRSQQGSNSQVQQSLLNGK